MYSKIILPLDGSELSEQALPYAQLVAKSLSVPIELVQAFDILPPGMLGIQSQRVIDQMVSGAQQRAEAILTSVRERLEADGHSVSVVNVAGNSCGCHRHPGQHRPDRVGRHVHPRQGWHRPLGAGQRYRQGVHTMRNPCSSSAPP